MPAMLASFNSEGQGFCNYSNGKIRLVVQIQSLKIKTNWQIESNYLCADIKWIVLVVLTSTKTAAALKNGDFILKMNLK